MFLSFSAASADVQITNDTLISETDFSLDGSNLVVSAATLTVDGAHTFGHVSLTNGAVMTHSTQGAGIDLNLSNLAVSASSSIDVVARGLPNQGTGDSGGSYGGRGGNDAGSSNPTYGDYREPDDLGAGGDATRGGGRIKIETDILTLDGAIIADGQSLNANSVGGGAGGAVWLDVGTLTGLGTISSDGGDLFCCGGGGGGGRIAIYYDDASGFNLETNVTAYGGLSTTDTDGGAGTIYYKDKAQPLGRLKIDNTPHGTRQVTEFKTNVVEETIEIVSAWVDFELDAEFTSLTATNSRMDQTVSLITSNLTVDGSTWNQDAAVTATVARITATTWTQNAVVDIHDLIVEGGTWIQNEVITVGNGLLEVDGTSWTQNEIISATNLTVNGSTWIQNTNSQWHTLSISNTSWTQNAPLSLSDLTGIGNSFRFDYMLTVTNLFDLEGVNLHQSADLILPTDNIIVDNWSWFLNMTDTWDQVSIVNGGVLSHDTEVDTMTLIANSVAVDSNSSINVESRGLPDQVSGDSGGSYGGRGGNDAGSSNPTYGDYRKPDELGAGGNFTRGGGRIKIEADILTLDGAIIADGQSLNANSVGGGAGGAVWLDVGTLTGLGTISSGGGDLFCCGGGGGGGRIAIYYDDASGFNLETNVTAYGGLSTSNIDGGAGTIYFKDKAQPLGRLKIDNTPHGTRQATEFKTNVVEETIEIVSAWVDFELDAEFTSLTATNSRIDQIGSLTVSNLTVHGGSWNQDAAVTAQVARIASTTWTQNGEVDMFDLIVTGGSWIQNEVITLGNGLLEVDGTSWTQNEIIIATNLTVNGSTWIQNTNSQWHTLSISNTSWTQNAPLSLSDLTGIGNSFRFDYMLTVTNLFDLEGVNLHQSADLILPTDDIIVDNWSWFLNMTDTWDQVSIVNGGVLSHDTEVDTMTLIANSVLVDSNSSVTVESRGLPEQGSGDSGGSYGGRGGNDAGSSIPTYGDYREPDELGAGGDLTRGGGRIKIETDILTLDGAIVADGQSLNANSVGGGAGGAVWLDVGTLTGVGTISSDGGDLFCCGGGGGGGRIAIYYDDASGFNLETNVTAYGGLSTSNIDGGAGTIYFKDKAQPLGRLKIDNTPHGTRQATEFKTNVVEEAIEIVSAWVDFELDAEFTSLTATNSRIDQSGNLSVSNLTVHGGSWNQDAAVTAQVARIASTTWTQNGEVDMFDLIVTGGSWIQNEVITLGNGLLEVDGTSWTQNEIIIATNLTVNGSTWIQNTNSQWHTLSISNTSWTQNAPLSLSDLTGIGNSFRFDYMLTVTNLFDLEGVNLHQSADLILPTDDIIVDNWSWFLNMTDTWDQVSIVNGGVLSHDTEVDTMTLIANSVLVDSNSSVTVESRGLPEQGSGDSGGSYGGRGGNDAGSSIPTYGDYREPDELGAGGDLTRGGGRIKIETDILTLDGAIVADGQSLNANSVGGGAGGAVWLDVGTLTGVGTISSDGGDLFCCGGGGGGGRIAIYYDDASGFNLETNVTAYGGLSTTDTDGGAGTIYYKDKAQPLGRLKIDNTPHGTRQVTEFKTNVVEETIEIVSAWVDFELDAEFTSLTATNSRIDQPVSLITSNLTVDGSTWNQDANVTAQVARITATTWTQNADVEIHDLIVEGGTWIQNEVITLGNGLLEVDGTSWTQNENINATNLSVVGSTWIQNTNSQWHTLSISNTSWTQNAPLSLSDLTGVGNSFHFDHVLTVTNLFDLEGVNLHQSADLILPTDDIVVDNWSWYLNMTDTWDQVSIVNGGVLSHDTEVDTMTLIANTVLVDSNSSVTVESRGLPEQGSGDSGGSYGGRGGNDAGSSNPTYGDYRKPDELGAGGNFTRGGGRIKIEADILTLDGAIIADGQSLNTSSVGGGAGGAVWLDVGTLTGLGTISSDGGDLFCCGGGGGGGRIAIYYDDASGFNLETNVTAYGGLSTSNIDGGAGTIYFKDKAQPLGRLKIDNTPHGTRQATEFKTNVVEEAIEIVSAWVDFELDAEFTSLTATNSRIDQTGGLSVSNLTARGGTWNQNGSVTSKTSVLEDLTWNQSGEMNVDDQVVDGGIWTQDGTISVPELDVRNGTWNQNTNLLVTNVDVSNQTWNLNAPNTLFSVTASDSSLLVTQPLTVSNLFSFSGGILTQDGVPLSLPADDLIVDGWTYVLNGSQTWDRIEVLNGGWVTHGVNVSGLVLHASSMLVDSNSMVDVTARGRGFSGTGFSGGSYGGLGGAVSGSPNPVYGDEFNPVDLGSGGRDTRGGGRILITTDLLDLEGDMLSRGQSTGINSDGGGSGGTINLNVGVLTGTGRLDASGGDSTFEAGGGGGRIAVVYDDASGFNLTSNILNLGGTGQFSNNGQTGTVFLLNRTNAVRVLEFDPEGAVPAPASSVKVLFNTGINSATFTTGDVRVVNSVGSTNFPTAVTASNAVLFELTFNPALDEDEYTIFIGPNIASNNGLEMDQNENDVIGEVPGDVFETSLVVDLTDPAPPVVTNYAAAPVTNLVNQSTVTLRGTREQNSSAVVDGAPPVLIGATEWSADVDLTEGLNSIGIYAEDDAGNTSTTTTVLFLSDTVAPQVTGIVPANFAFTSAPPATIEVSITEITSGLDLAASDLSVKEDGTAEVVGTWVATVNGAAFTPSNALVDAEYNLSLTFHDQAGNESSTIPSRFTVDTVAPAPPVIDSVDTPTAVSNQVVSGSREAFAEVRESGSLVVGRSSLTDWSYLQELAAFSNTFSYTQVDRAGNISSATNVFIFYEDPPPFVVDVTLPAEGGTSSAVTNSLTLTFSESLNPVTVSNAANFELLGSGADDNFDTQDDEAYPVGVSYAGGPTVDLVLDSGPLQPGEIRFRALSGLEDTVGNSLDPTFTRSFSIASVEHFRMEPRTNDTAALAGFLDEESEPPEWKAGGGRGSLFETNDVDVWAFSVQAGERMILGMENPSDPASSTLSAEIRDPDGLILTNLLTDSVGRLSSPVLTASSNGTHTVHVTRSDDFDGEYRLRVFRAATNLTAESESNDSLPQATPMPLTVSGSTNDGSAVGYLSTGADTDWFNIGFLTNQSTVIAFVGPATGGEAVPSLGIYDSNGVQRLEVGGAAGDGFVEARIESNGVYYAQVASGDGGGSLLHDYVMDVLVVPTASLQLPNLRVPEVSAPTGSLFSGQSVDFSYTVTNAGALAASGTNWTDRVVVSENTEFGDSDDLFLDDIAVLGGLGVGGAYTNQVNVDLPDGVDGDFYLLVEADATNAVDEGVFESDNTGVSPLFTVSRSDYPDLQAESVSTGGVLEVGATVTVSWVTANRGAVSTATSFVDRVTVTNLTTGLVLSDTQHPVTDLLAMDGEALQSVEFVPAAAGLHEVRITADAGDDIFEFDGSGHASAEQNTVSTSLTIRQFYDVTLFTNPPSGGAASGSGHFLAGSTVTVTAVANTNSLPYFFENWTEGGAEQSTSAAYVFTLSDDRNLTANFTLPSYTVTASAIPSAGGSISGEGTFFYAETNTLVATPNAGYEFLKWEEDSAFVSSNATLVTQIFTNHAFDAIFDELVKTHTVTTATSPTGLAAVAGSGVYTNGEQAAFSAPGIVTNDGVRYTFQQFTENGAFSSASTSYNKTFSTLDPSNLTVAAVYSGQSIKPLVTSAFGSPANPVPYTTNFALTVQFDRTMQTGSFPVIVLTNAALERALVSETGGLWSATAVTEDTYTRGGFVFTNGMDGVWTARVDSAEALGGEVLTPTNVYLLDVNSTRPEHPEISLTDSNRISVTVGWAGYAPPSDLAEYRVYRETVTFTSVETLVPIAVLPTNATDYVLTGLDRDRLYKVAVTAVDTAGNEIPEVSPIDVLLRNQSFAPSAPVLDPVSTPTSIRLQTVAGSKEAGTGIRQDQNLVVPVDASTNWNVTIVLEEGTNSLSFVAVDAFGYFSPAAVTDIVYTDVPPGDVTLSGDGVGDGTSVDLTWDAYDEVANGADIFEYRLYRSLTNFTSVTGATQIAVVPGGTQTYTATGLSRNVTSWFGAVAVDLASNISAGITATNVLTVDVTPPADPIGLQATSTSNSVTLFWTPPADADLAGFEVYPTNRPTGTSIPLGTNSYSLTGLTAATAYDFRVTSADGDGNESAGADVTGITWLESPANLAVEPLNARVSLSWDPVTPGALLKHYAVYVSTSSFTSVTGMAPSLITASTQPSLAGLENGVPYHFAVVSVNLSDDFNPSGSTVSATPAPDTTGPTVTNLLFNGSPITNNLVLTRPGTVSVEATDISGMSAVEFFVDGAKRVTDFTGTPAFSFVWDITAIPDGVTELRVDAVDTVNNRTSLTNTVEVALGPPATAPAITHPANGTISSRRLNVFRGTTDPFSETVQLYVDGVQTGAAAAVSVDGDFDVARFLHEGTNTVQAASVNRGGESPLSPAINVVVDTSVPGPPLGVSANTRAGGEVKLRWRAPLSPRIAGYDIYRSDSSFASTADAIRVNSALIPVNVYDDLPVTDGTNVYRLQTVNTLGTRSELSTEVEAVSDSTAPQASVQFSSTGSSVGSRYSTGSVSVAVTVTEELLTKPFFSLTRTNGFPISVALARDEGLTYEGVFDIEPGDPQGLLFSVFSGRDKVGNRGTEVTGGSQILVDTVGPTAAGIGLTPSPPLENDSGNPLDLTVDLSFSTDDLPLGTPELSYRLSLSQTGKTPVVLSQVSATLWQGQITLPASAGLTNELIRFLYSGTDQVDNVSTAVLSKTAFQVYQGDLPPLDPPAGLTAESKTGGMITLAWDPVDEAADYALYRQAPGDGALQFRSLSGSSTTVTRTAPDGTNFYAVASVRSANGQTVTGSLSSAVSAVADGTSPTAPGNLTVLPDANGLFLSWHTPAGDPVEYRVYREASSITNVTGLSPLIGDLPSTNALDRSPLPGGAFYAVTALDALGNESLPSASVFTNLALLPVNSLHVEKTEGELPELTWTHADAGNIDGFHVYLVGTAGVTRLNQALLSNTTFTYTDTGYDATNRRYGVTAVDVVNSTEVESGRSEILLPLVDVVLDAEATVNRGVMNRLTYAVTNRSGESLEGLHVEAAVDDYRFESAEFDLSGLADTGAVVAVGGQADFSDTLTVTNTLRIQTIPEKRVRLHSVSEVPVFDDLISLEIFNDDLQRGSDGQVRFVLHNTGSETVEIIIGRNAGPSSDVRVKLLDEDNSVYASAPMAQFGGDQVVTLFTGDTVARIAPGERFTSDPIPVPVPASADASMKLRVEIDTLYNRLGFDNEQSIPGLSAGKDVSLGNIVFLPRDEVPVDGRDATELEAVTPVEIKYRAEATNVFPLTSFGETNITIQGAAERFDNGLPALNKPVKVVVSLNGFERRFDVFTDENGEWEYAFIPEASEGGEYVVYAVHPRVTDKRNQGGFVIQVLEVSPIRGNLTSPYNADQALDISLFVGDGVVVSNARLSYLAEDQDGDTFTPGITFTPDAAVASATGERVLTLGGSLQATTNAPETGELVLRVESDSPDPGIWGRVTVNYTFVEPPQGVDQQEQPTFPVVFWDPGFIETGVAVSNIVVSEFSFDNRGYEAVSNMQFALLNTNGAPAPDWVRLNAESNLAELAVGQSHPVGISFTPDGSVTPSSTTPYEYVLRFHGDNYPTNDIPIFVYVDESGTGSALFKVMDIFTGTLDDSNNLVEGLEDARIKLIKETGSIFVTNLTTDAIGEAFAQDLPVGRYSVRVQAPNHTPRNSRIFVNPGATASREFTLQNELVSVEWSVREITIQDKYEVVLRTTFETDVPAAVVVAEPSSIPIPDLEPGDSVNGEYLLKNHGLIRAEEISVSVPSPGPFYKIEILKPPPQTMEAKEVVRVPYRITCIADINGAEAEAGGGGCRTISKDLNHVYVYECINESEFGDQTPVYMTKAAGCSDSTLKDITSGTTFQDLEERVNQIGGFRSRTAANWGSGGGSGGSGTEEREQSGGGIPAPENRTPRVRPEPQQAEGLVCAPVGKCEADDQDCLCSARQRAGSWVNLVRGEYEDHEQDLVVNVLGHTLTVERMYYADTWLFNPDWQPIDFEFETPEVSYQGGFQAVVASRLERIISGGAVYRRSDTDGTVWRNGNRFFFRTTNGYRRVDAQGNVRRYDFAGNLQEFHDRNGVRCTMQYDANTNLTGVLDHHGVQALWLTFTNGRVSTVSDQASGGRSVHYSYNGQGRLASVTDVRGYVTTYGYNGAGLLNFKQAPNGKTRSMSYTPEGYLTSLIDQDGKGRFFSWDYNSVEKEHYSFIQTTDGDIIEEWFDEDGNSVRRDINGVPANPPEPDRQVSSVFASVAGTRGAVLSSRVLTTGSVKAESEQDPLRTELDDGTVIRRDEAGNVVEEIYPDGTSISREYEPVYNQVVREENEAGRVTLYEYDETGNLTNLIHAAGTPAEMRTELVYDTFGQVITAVEKGGGGTADAVTTFTYDANGNRTSLTDPLGNVISNLYDRLGNVTQSVDAVGQIWTFDYDAAGNLLKTVKPDGTVLSNEYDEVGNRITQYDERGLPTLYTYDGDGRLLSETDQQGRTTTYEYDFDGRLTRQVDPDGNEIGAEYDAAGRAVKTWTSPDRVTRFTYNRNGDIVKKVDPDGNVETITYNRAGHPVRWVRGDEVLLITPDARGRMTKLLQLGGGVVRTNRYVYDDQGLLTEFHRAGGAYAIREFDARGRVIEAVNSGIQTNRNEYDARGNLVRITDSAGVTVELDYDLNDRPVRKTYEDGSFTELTYDGLGRITSLLDRNGRKMDNAYNVDNRITNRTWFAAGDHTTAVKTVQYQYDAVNRLTNWSDGTFSSSYVYDDANRTVRQTVDYGPFSKSDEFTYDARDRVTTYDGPAGNTMDFTYNGDNLLTSATLNDTRVFAFNEINRGRVLKAVYPGGTTFENEFGPFGLTNYVVRDVVGNAIFRNGLEVNQGDQIIRQSRTEGIYTFSYDLLGRLIEQEVPEISEVSGFQDESFSYDRRGNRISGPDAQTYEANALNQITNRTNGTYTYDSGGNMTLRGVNGVTNAFEYDVVGNLTAVRDGDGGLIAEYAYSPGGKRLMKNVGGEITYYFYSRDGLVAEFDGAGNVIRSYGYAPGTIWGEHPMFMKVGGAVYYYINNHLGAPQAMFNENGAIVWKGYTDAFGKVHVDPASSVDNPLRFSSQYYDEESGLHYNTQRYYDPGLGRYLTPDPYGESVGYNLYAFAHNNPLGFVDRRGTHPALDLAIVGGTAVLKGSVDVNNGPNAEEPGWDSRDTRIFVVGAGTVVAGAVIASPVLVGTTIAGAVASAPILAGVAAGALASGLWDVGRVLGDLARGGDGKGNLGRAVNDGVNSVPGSVATQIAKAVLKKVGIPVGNNTENIGGIFIGPWVNRNLPDIDKLVDLRDDGKRRLNCEQR